MAISARTATGNKKKESANAKVRADLDVNAIMSCFLFWRASYLHGSKTPLVHSETRREVDDGATETPVPG
jgi:hypothetical protein